MATVPMFDPQGTVRLVPQDQAQNALSSGGKPAVKMLDPQGTARWVPQDQQQNAPEGWKLADSTATPDAQPTQPDTSIGGRIKSSLQGIWEGNADPVTNLSIGAVKQGMGLIGGIMKIAHDKVGAGPQPSDVLEYKQANPTATDEQALDAVSKGYRGPTTTASRDKMAARADWLLRNSETKGFFQGAGGFGENLAELVGLTAAGDPEAAAAHGGPELVGDAAKVWKMMEANTLAGRLLRVGWAAVKGAGEQGAQTYVHTGGNTAQTGVAAAAGGILGPLGQAVAEIPGFLGRAASEVQPVERTMEGVPYTQLASELRDAQGRPQAPPRADQFNLQDFPEMAADRLAAFKQMQTNLARRATAAAVADTNDAISASQVSGNIRGTAPTDVVGKPDMWRYIPPDGSASLSAPEARSALDEMKQLWLSKEWPPEQEQQISQAYNDMQSQLERHDSYTASQPYEFQDPANTSAGVNSWRDAANNIDALAKVKGQQLGLSKEFNQLVKARDAAQDAFDQALEGGTWDDRVAAQKQVNQAGDELANFVKTQGAQPQISPVIAGRMLEEQRTANAFREWQNTLDRHLTLTDETQAAVNQPQEMRRQTSFVDDMENLKQKYGDVLNPLVGDQAINHSIELGNTLINPSTAGRSQDILENLMLMAKRQMHMGGIRTAFGLGSPALAGFYLLGHSVAGAAGGLAVGATGAGYKYLLRRMASEPEFSQAFINAAKSNSPVSVAAGQLARFVATAGSTAARKLANAQ